MGDRPNAHTVAFPIAPTPANTADPISAPSIATFTSLGRDARSSVESVTADEIGPPISNTCRNTSPTAKQAAAPGPNGFRLTPTCCGPSIERRASHLLLPANTALADSGVAPDPMPMPKSHLPVTISILG